MGEKVYVYDTTLRDGSQAEGVNFSIEDKLRIIKKLDEFSIDYIECGWPGSNPKDTLLFEKLKNIKLNTQRSLPLVPQEDRAKSQKRTLNLKT